MELHEQGQAESLIDKAPDYLKMHIKNKVHLRDQTILIIITDDQTIIGSIYLLTMTYKYTTYLFLRMLL